MSTHDEEPCLPPPPDPDFTLDLLAELRASRFRAAGWRRFWARSWHRARATATEHPRLVASWAGVTGALAGMEALALVAEAWAGAGVAARLAAPRAALLLALQQADVYVHLGMNNAAPGTALWNQLGAATTLTLGRQAVAGLLWAHLLAGQPAGRAYCAIALATAATTDIADGSLARGQRRVTRLGQYLDASADFSMALALACTLARRRLVPCRLVALEAVRWAVPWVYALYAYFGNVQRVPIGSTRLGKLAGFAQALTFGAALMPLGSSVQLARLRHRLVLVTSALRIAIPLAQWRRLRRTRVVDPRMARPE